MTLGDLYLQILVPFFATVAFALSVWKFFEDRRRAARRFSVKVDGARFQVVNESSVDLFLDAGGYIDAKWKAQRGAFDPMGEPTNRIERNGTLVMICTLHTTLSAAMSAFSSGPALEARGWWAEIVTGERATTIPWWNVYGRARFWLANR